MRFVVVDDQAHRTQDDFDVHADRPFAQILEIQLDAIFHLRHLAGLAAATGSTPT